jgi:hypothetical protein
MQANPMQLIDAKYNALRVELNELYKRAPEINDQRRGQYNIDRMYLLEDFARSIGNIIQKWHEDTDEILIV